MTSLTNSRSVLPTKNPHKGCPPNLKASGVLVKMNKSNFNEITAELGRYNVAWIICHAKKEVEWGKPGILQGLVKAKMMLKHYHDTSSSLFRQSFVSAWRIPSPTGRHRVKVVCLSVLRVRAVQTTYGSVQYGIKQVWNVLNISNLILIKLKCN